MLYQLSVIFILALVLLVVSRRLALAIGLVDKPSVRKRHHGHIPLVGGIAIYLTLALLYCWRPGLLAHGDIYFACVTALLLLGVMDDRFDLPVTPRVAVQGAVALAMMLMADLQLASLGQLWGQDTLLLGNGALWLTPLAVWAAINAYNMIDGIDGQLGTLSCVTFAALALLFTLGGRVAAALWCLSLIAALAAYLLFNLGVFGRRNKIFMGDAGSMVIGFSVLWLLLSASQGAAPVMRPVTALWLIAIPLMDMVSVMAGRLLRGQNPFRAGRDHLHHMLMRRGLSARQALGMSSLLAVALACLGVLGEMLWLPENLMLLAFVLCFGGYLLLLRQPREPAALTDSPSADR
ncbi:UDP-N-acetylglucosamine--undecaprenyl-phosphate N-acetylglucosaminephosphotransferase [Serratia sp. AKBS12]|uniref:UDP-N-acetylglucosamine--undecaprenyl-phosphate N-acetylglucosaminephosphotransferase n=1 Tax=Serratia sp. AKBS12 TaxID=2974597 RepID=UPI00216543A0|nr:UDP-N-acetylglucosamine--undecaprenyl-phosphate N-acetylglucosaminephosphotransferase [Serratia sp. AKBS12]MCS3408223.1 UDP-N-acetylglucosamine--undecaprenyl-phosphate N-acetylglucosaminephosphotransferase [Serratia sp. AKBS12]